MTLSDKLKKLPKKIDSYKLQMGVTTIGSDEVFYCGYLIPWNFTKGDDSVNGEPFVSYNAHEGTFYSYVSLEQAIELVYDWCEDNNKLV